MSLTDLNHANGKMNCRLWQQMVVENELHSSHRKKAKEYQVSYSYRSFILADKSPPQLQQKEKDSFNKEKDKETQIQARACCLYNIFSFSSLL